MEAVVNCLSNKLILRVKKLSNNGNLLNKHSCNEGTLSFSPNAYFWQ